MCEVTFKKNENGFSKSSHRIKIKKYTNVLLIQFHARFERFSHIFEPVKTVRDDKIADV